MMKQDNAPSPRLDTIAQFRSITAIDSPELPELMGSLKGKIAPQAFSDFCSAFADGVAYIRDKYHVQPAFIAFDSEHTNDPYEFSKMYGIHIPLAFIEKVVSKPHGSNDLVLPFQLQPMEAAKIYGVNEAYSIVQTVRQPETSHTFSALERTKLELEAAEEVHAAMVDFGITKTAPISPYNTHKTPSSWATDILKERTQVTPNSPAF